MSAARQIQRHRVGAKSLHHLKVEAAVVSRTSRPGSQRRTAKALGIRPSHMAGIELASEPHAATVVHVAAAPESERPWAEALIRWQACKHDLQVLRAAPNVHGDNHGARLAAVISELTDVMREFSKALANGRLEHLELRILVTESGEAIGALLELQRYATDTLAANGGPA